MHNDIKNMEISMVKKRVSLVIESLMLQTFDLCQSIMAVDINMEDLQALQKDWNDKKTEIIHLEGLLTTVNAANYKSVKEYLKSKNW